MLRLHWQIPSHIPVIPTYEGGSDLNTLSHRVTGSGVVYVEPNKAVAFPLWACLRHPDGNLVTVAMQISQPSSDSSAQTETASDRAPYLTLRARDVPAEQPSAPSSPWQQKCFPSLPHTPQSAVTRAGKGAGSDKGRSRSVSGLDLYSGGEPGRWNPAEACRSRVFTVV